MSIQSNINQGIAIAGALLTQTPKYEENKQKALNKAEAKKIDKKIENVESNILQQQLEIDAEKGERRDALIKDLDKPWNSKASQKKILAQYDAETAAKERELSKMNVEASKEKISLLKQKGDLLGDYEPYITERLNYAAANAKANDKKRVKKEQMTAVTDLLNMQTNLGGTVSDLKLNNNQLKVLKKQLKGNK